MHEPYASASHGELVDFGPSRVPAGHYFVLADQRGLGCESSVTGPAPRAAPVVEVVGVYWPPGRAGVP